MLTGTAHTQSIANQPISKKSVREWLQKTATIDDLRRAVYCVIKRHSHKEVTFEDREDIVQDSCVAILKRDFWSKLCSEVELRKYCCGIARNVARDFLHANWQVASPLCSSAIPDTKTPSPEAQMEGRDVRRSFYNLMKVMPKYFRDAYFVSRSGRPERRNSAILKCGSSATYYRRVNVARKLIFTGMYTKGYQLFHFKHRPPVR